MSHYYALDGTPTYELKGANGKMRPTTIRDARKLTLVPSVTTIMAVQDKPALLIWKQGQILDAVLNNPINPLSQGALVDYWRKEIVSRSNDVGRKAAENGNIIHDSLEQYIKDGVVDTKMLNIVEPVMNFLKENFSGFEWVAEDSFAHPLGFGGKIDLYGVKNKGKDNEQRMVLDFKTKNKGTDDIEKLKAYDDHHLQTAAYTKGLEDTKFDKNLDYSAWGRYNLFIGYEIVDNSFVFTGLKLTESKDFEREWGMFEKLLEFWKLKNNYQP